MEENKLTADIDLGLAKILVMANIINRKTELCCFVNDNAHVRKIDIRLYQDIKSYTGIPVSFEVSYDTSKEYIFDVDTVERLNEIERCVEFLETTLKERNIEYNMLHVVKEYVIAAYEI